MLVSDFRKNSVTYSLMLSHLGSRLLMSARLKFPVFAVSLSQKSGRPGRTTVHNGQCEGLDTEQRSRQVGRRHGGGDGRAMS